VQLTPTVDGATLSAMALHMRGVSYHYPHNGKLARSDVSCAADLPNGRL
jgi:hypothetical protein